MRDPYACAATFITELFDKYEPEDLLPESLIESGLENNEAKAKAMFIRMLKVSLHAVFKAAADPDYVEQGIAAFKAEAAKIAEEWKAENATG